MSLSESLLDSVNDNLDLLRSLGINYSNVEPQLYASLEDENFVRLFIKENNLTDNDFVAIIHPFAGYQSKNWQEDKFAELIRVLFNRYNARIILVGSAKDKEAGEDIIRMSKVPAINLAGKTSLGELTYLFKKMNVFIGVDSGPAHIAALTKKPTVIIYSGTNRPEEWAPAGEQVVVIRKDVECGYCEKLNCKDNICMKMISVEDVLGAIRQAAGI